MTLLSIKNASKHYAGIPALRAASLEIAPGEVHALIGENGAGKSTLIKIMAGVVSPDHVEIHLNDQPIQIHNAAQAFAHGFRFIHQELNVVPHLSVAENIFLGHAYPQRMGLFVNWAALNQAALGTLARLGVDHINPKQKIARLSTGDQMLVKIAAMLLGTDGKEALVYVMDEPTAALTGREAERLFTVIAELKAQGRSIIYISHRLEEVFRICDRATVMRDGETVATRPVADLTQREIIQLMTGRDMAESYPPAKQPVQDRIMLDVRALTSDAVNQVQFQVRAGEIFGIAGLSDSGQSALLQALIGADPQKERDVWLDGQQQGRLDPAAAWSNQMAYVPQERRSQGLMLSRSIRDNVTLPHLHKLSRGGAFLDRRRETQQTQQLGEQVQLRATGVTQLSYQLSGGNQQKVVFARALAENPKLLLLDEPTRGVDVGAKYDIYTLIRNLSAKGTAVIMASSDLSELLGMCDRIMVMVAHQPYTIVDTVDLTQASLLSLCYGTLA